MAVTKSPSQASVRRLRRAGAFLTSMNSLKIRRTLMAAIAMTPSDTAALGSSAPSWLLCAASHEAKRVMTMRAPQASDVLASDDMRIRSPHDVEQGEDYDPQEI